MISFLPKGTDFLGYGSVGFRVHPYSNFNEFTTSYLKMFLRRYPRYKVASSYSGGFTYYHFQSSLDLSALFEVIGDIPLVFVFDNMSIAKYPKYFYLFFNSSKSAVNRVKLIFECK